MREYLHGENSAVPLGNVPLAKDPSGNLVAHGVDAAGNLNVNVAAGVASGGTSSAFGAALPATGTAVGMKDSAGKMAAANLDAGGNLLVNVAAGGAGGGAVTVADGADVTQGAVADAGVVTDAGGSLSAKLRGLITILLRGFALATPLRTDPVGSTSQPVTGSVTANAGTNLNTSSLALETGGNLAGAKTDLDALALANNLYTQKIEYSAGNPLYMGWAAPGTAVGTAAWRICKLTFSADGMTDRQWAGGSLAFATKWDDRAAGGTVYA